MCCIVHALKTLCVDIIHVRRFKETETDRKKTQNPKKQVDNNRPDIRHGRCHHDQERRNNLRLDRHCHRNVLLHHRKDPETHPSLGHEEEYKQDDLFHWPGYFTCDVVQSSKSEEMAGSRSTDFLNLQTYANSTASINLLP